MNTNDHGWLIDKLIDLDVQYQGRYKLWEHTLKKGELIAEIPQIEFYSFGDRPFDETLMMVEACLEVIPQHRGGMGQTQAIRIFCYWLSFAFGHPSVPKLEESIPGMSDRILKVLDLDLWMRCPGDYLGHLLAKQSYGKQSSQFYPTLQPVARMMAQVAVHAARLHPRSQMPCQCYDPCIGSGRLALEMLNYCRSLVGWERNLLLMQVAIVNFMLFAPDFALPIPALGGDLIAGDTLTGVGTSWIRGVEVRQEMPSIEFPKEQPKVTKSKQKSEKDVRDLQQTLF